MGSKIGLIWFTFLILSLFTSSYTISQGTLAFCNAGCYDPDLAVEVGDIITWYVKGLIFTEASTVTLLPSNEESSQTSTDVDQVPIIVVEGPRKVISIDLEILQSIKGVPRKAIQDGPEEYYRTTAMVNITSSISSSHIVGLEEIAFNKIPVSLIIATSITGSNGELDNLLEFFANTEAYEEFKSVDLSAKEGKYVGSDIIIERYIEGNRYHEVKYTNSTDSEGYSWQEYEIKEIDLHTGFLLIYNFTKFESGGTILEGMQISNQPFKPGDEAILDLNISKYFLVGAAVLAVFAIIVLPKLNKRRGLDGKSDN